MRNEEWMASLRICRKTCAKTVGAAMRRPPCAILASPPQWGGGPLAVVGHSGRCDNAERRAWGALSAFGHFPTAVGKHGMRRPPLPSPLRGRRLSVSVRWHGAAMTEKAVGE